MLIDALKYLATGTSRSDWAYYAASRWCFQRDVLPALKAVLLLGIYYDGEIDGRRLKDI